MKRTVNTPPLPDSSSIFDPIPIVSMDENVVHEGDTVIVKMHDELDTMMRVVSHTEQKVGKGRVDVSPLVGVAYGSVFEIRGRKLVKVDGISSKSEGKLYRL